MGDFGFYFTLGWEHIISADALDHQLFIAALAAIYLLKDWKQVLILVTAFTIGHSLTLALSVLNIISVPAKWVDRKSTRLNSSHVEISYAVFCLKKKRNKKIKNTTENCQ